MKNFGILVLLIIGIFGFYQCKNNTKEVTQEVATVPAAPQQHSHCYKYYVMKFNSVKRESGKITGMLETNDNKKYSFLINSDLDTILGNPLDQNKTHEVYTFVKGENKYQNCNQLFKDNLPLLILSNKTLKNNTNNDNCPKNSFLRGTYGCNPKLLYNDKGIINFTVDGDTNHKYLPLPTAVHKDLNGHVADSLSCYCFKISNSDFINLDNITKGKKNLELALDSITNDTLKILRVINPADQSDLFRATEQK